MTNRIILMLAAAILLTMCAGKQSPPAKTITAAETAPLYQWDQVSKTAAFPKSYNFQMFSVKDTLWAMHPQGTYCSTDGKDWHQTSLIHIIKNSAFLDFVYFKDALYGLGTFQGNIEEYTMTSAIAKTSDFRSWEIITKNSNLPPRFFYHPFVFNNKIWMIGGNDGKTDYADIWSSEDAVHWIKRKDHLPFGKRSGSQIVQLRGTLYLLDNDVWSSSDGLNWTLVTPQIVKGQELFGYTATVFDNRIFLLGCNRNGQFTSKVMSSADGKTWQEMDAPWSPRGGIAACVFKNKIFMTGGKFGGTPAQTVFVYSNDVWTLKR